MSDAPLHAAAWPRHLQPYLRPCPDELCEALRATRPGASRLVVAALGCRCGEESLLVGVSYNWEVVDAACAACGHELPIYDPKHHGRAGARGANDYPRPPFETVPFGCMCRMMSFQVAVGLEPDGAGAGDADPEAFLFIAVAGRCAACGMSNSIFDTECD